MPHTQSIRIFSRQEVEFILSMEQSIPLMESAFSQLSLNKAIVPIRTHLDLKRESAEALFMPVYLADQAQTALKMVNINHQNPAQNLPYIQAMMIVSDAQTGQALGLMDAASITAIRTGAATGLATKLLARENAATLAIFGTGGQAFRQIEAVLAVRNIKRVWVYGRNKEKGKLFVEKIRESLRVDCEWTDSLDKLKFVDVICTATNSPKPLFAYSHLNKGVHINGIGAYRADMAEVPADVVAKARVYVDQLEACLKEAGDIIQAIEEGLLNPENIVGELGELVLRKIVGRTNEEEITFFKSVGNAAQDLVCASYVLKAGKERKLGTEVSL